jgi:spermidine/putrescine transport system substrate-binding protein
MIRNRKACGAGPMGHTRREMMALGAAGIGIAAMPLIPGTARADSDHAVMFTWGGYELPGFDDAYIEKYGESPDFSFFGDEDEAFAKVVSGFTPDLAHPCSSLTQKWVDAELIQPIDVSRLSNWPDLYPMMQDLPGTIFGGEHYFVPWDWGWTSITYRTDLVDVGEEESYSLLWDERYAGKLAVIDAVGDTGFIAAIYLGLDPFHLTLDQIAEIKELLVKQKPLLRMYTNDLSSVEQGLASGELVAALTWNDSPINLIWDDVPVRYMQPKEGALVWACGYVLIKGAPHLDRAYELLDNRLDTRSGYYIMTEYGYGHSNAKSAELFSAEDLDNIGLPRDQEEFLNNAIIGGMPENYEALIMMFEEVKAGF